MSQKEPTRPTQFDNSAADERKMKELYGNSNYKPLGKQKPTGPATPATDNRRSRKANELQSNILTHADDELRN